MNDEIRRSKWKYFTGYTKGVATALVIRQNEYIKILTAATLEEDSVL